MKQFFEKTGKFLIFVESMFYNKIRNSRMKQLALLLISLLVISCEKSTEPEEPLSIKTLEGKWNIAFIIDSNKKEFCVSTIVIVNNDLTDYDKHLPNVYDLRLENDSLFGDIYLYDVKSKFTGSLITKDKFSFCLWGLKYKDGDTTYFESTTGYGERIKNEQAYNKDWIHKRDD
jgi:hypothetical protein